jgi:hypothetical protein
LNLQKSKGEVMAKFHVSPNSGEAGECKAKLQCPFGGDDKHFPTKEAARQSFEETMKDSTFAPLSKRSEVRDAEVSKAIYALISSGDDSYLYNAKAAENWAKKTGGDQEIFQAAIDQLKKEDDDEQAAKEAKRDAKAREIVGNTDPDVSKVKKGSTVVIKNSNTLVKVKVTSHRNGKISGNGDDGNYYSGESDSEILTSASKLEGASQKEPAAPAVDAEVAEARRMMLDTGDADSFLYNPNAAKYLAGKTGLKEEKIQAAIDEFEREDQAELEAKEVRKQKEAREVAVNTDPDISKIKKGSKVAYKFGDKLVTVTVSSHRNGKISGNTSDGTFADRWDNHDVLTSESKLDD